MTTVKFNPQTEILPFDLFSSQSKIALTRPKSEFKIQNNFEKISEVLTLARLTNTRFKNPDFLNYLSTKSLNEIIIGLTPKTGQTFLNITKEYGFTEYLRTILQYLKDYGNFDIPNYMFEPISKFEMKYPKTNKTFDFDDSVYINELEIIFNSKKNPTTRDLAIISSLENATELKTGLIQNRIVLKRLSEIEDLKLQCVIPNTAALRAYIEGLKKNQERLKTSQKTLILKNLEKLKTADVLDDFATHPKFWKRIESEIKPTQKRYKKYTNARIAFSLLRDNNFSGSNNSYVESAFMNSDFENLIKILQTKKSNQYILRNLTRIIKTHNPTQKQLESLKNLDVTLKQVLECWIGLRNPGISKVKTKFYNYKKEPISRPKHFELVEVLRHLAKTNFLEKTKIFMDSKELRDSEIPEVERPLEELAHIPMPVQNDAFYDIDLNQGYFTRGSKVPLSRFGNFENGFSVFVAWKRKDNQEGDLDLDLSACLNGTKHVNYCYLESKDEPVKHSGDYTSCRPFNPKDGLITCEAINVGPNFKGTIDFTLNSFNRVDLNEYDVYVGIADYINDFGYDYDDENHSFLSLNDAKFIAKITSLEAGYLHLGTIDTTFETFLLTGVQMSGCCFVPSDTQGSNISMVDEYYSNFLNCPSVYSFIEFLKTDRKADKGTYNPFRLKQWLDYIVNL